MLEDVCRPMGLDWTIKNPKFIEGTKTLISAGLGGSWTVQSLSNFEPCEDDSCQVLKEYGRANFGVQQLPLFNLLRPEDVDWLSCLS